MSVSGAISELNQTINTFETRVDVHVQNIHQSSVNVDAATDRIYQKILQFREEMEHGEQKQLAHENIIRIDQIIKENCEKDDGFKKAWEESREEYRIATSLSFGMKPG